MSKSKKKKVLVFCDWFVPGFKAGGPIRSVFNIVEGLKKEVDFWVVTRDTDLGELEPYNDVESDRWLKRDGYHVCYLSNRKRRITNLFKIIKETDCNVIYLNSLFSPEFALLPLLLVKLFKNDIRVVLAPRGMLGVGALNIKTRKKTIFLKFSRMIGFYRNVVWHASTPTEMNQIRDSFGTNINIFVARNMSSPYPEEIHSLVKRRHELKLIFLARVSIVKNLHLALDYLLKSANSVRESEVYFDIYGPLEEQVYWEDCQKIISEMPSNIHISYRGELPYPEVSGKLGQYHFLYLPTSTENYGHAIVESLIHGVPVIISDQTPWKDLCEHKAGWDIAVADEQKYQDVLRYCSEMGSQEYGQWVDGAREYAKRYILSDEVKNENLGLFMETDDF